MTGVCQKTTKFVEVILEKAFPKQVAHVFAVVARISSGHFKLHLAVASTGHGVFKGVGSAGRYLNKGRERGVFGRVRPKQDLDSCWRGGGARL
jgi:hypothetical protein